MGFIPDRPFHHIRVKIDRQFWTKWNLVVRLNSRIQNHKMFGQLFLCYQLTGWDTIPRTAGQSRGWAPRGWRCRWAGRGGRRSPPGRSSAPGARSPSADWPCRSPDRWSRPAPGQVPRTPRPGPTPSNETLVSGATTSLSASLSSMMQLYSLNLLLSRMFHVHARVRLFNHWLTGESSQYSDCYTLCIAGLPPAPLLKATDYYLTFDRSQFEARKY